MEKQIPQAATPPLSKDGVSPLGNYLNIHFSAAVYKEIEKDLVEPFFAGALSLATQYPFDPNERLNGINQHTDIHILEAILRLGSSRVWQFEDVKWPDNPEEFGSLGLGNEMKSSEWFCALLVAMGANPWGDLKVRPCVLPRAVALAVSLGMPGLVEKFLAYPGAWTAQEVMDAAYPAISQYDQQGSLWEIVSANNNATRGLEAMLRAGARIPGAKQAVEILGRATPEQAKMVAKFDLPDLSAKDRSKIATRWRDRSNSGALSIQEIEGMAKSLWKEESDPGLSGALMEATKLLSQGWNSYSNYGVNYGEILPGEGAEKLCARTKVKGAVAGEWSVLAAVAFSSIKVGTSKTTMEWSVANMLMQDRVGSLANMKSADCASPPFKGSLANAIGFDWKPGIKIDGIVALSLFSQNEKSNAFYDKAKTERKQRLQDFANAAGIEDLREWATKSMKDAAEFTASVLNRGNTASEARRTFYYAWSQSLSVEPSLANGLDTRQRVSLLSSFMHPEEQNIGRIQDLAHKMGEDTSPQELLSGRLSGHEQALSLLLHIYRAQGFNANRHDHTNLRQVLASDLKLDWESIDLLKFWVAKSHEEDMAPFQAQIEAREMALKTASTPTRSVRAMRL